MFRSRFCSYSDNEPDDDAASCAGEPDDDAASCAGEPDDDDACAGEPDDDDACAGGTVACWPSSSASSSWAKASASSSVISLRGSLARESSITDRTTMRVSVASSSSPSTLVKRRTRARFATRPQSAARLASRCDCRGGGATIAGGCKPLIPSAIGANPP